MLVEIVCPRCQHAGRVGAGTLPRTLVCGACGLKHVFMRGRSLAKPLPVRPPPPRRRPEKPDVPAYAVDNSYYAQPRARRRKRVSRVPETV